MYQCSFFYTADLVLPHNQDMVVAAWSVTADRAYHYDLDNDPLALPHLYSLIRTTEGAGIVETVHNTIRLPADTVVILPRTQILRYRSAQAVWKYDWVDFISLQEIRLPCGTVRTAHCTEKETGLFAELLRVGQTYPHELPYIYSIFVQYCYVLTFANTDNAKQNAPKILFSEICDYIAQKLYAHLTVQEVADFFGVSARRIHQIFRENTDCSPKQYITQQKTDKAKQLLCETAASVTDIADLLGYDNAYHFSAAFKKQTGTAPREYRKRTAAQTTCAAAQSHLI